MTTKTNGISIYPDDMQLGKILEFSKIENRKKANAVIRLVEIALQTEEEQQKLNQME